MLEHRFFNKLLVNARGTVEPPRKIFDGVDVTAYSFVRVVKTLEFLQHHFAKLGHRNTSCDPHLHQVIEQPTLHYLTRSVRRRAATSKRRYRSSGFTLPTR